MGSFVLSCPFFVFVNLYGPTCVSVSINVPWCYDMVKTTLCDTVHRLLLALKHTQARANRSASRYTKSLVFYARLQGCVQRNEVP